MKVTQVVYVSTSQQGELVPVTGALMRPIVSPLAKQGQGDAHWSA